MVIPTAIVGLVRPLDHQRVQLLYWYAFGFGSYVIPTEEIPAAAATGVISRRFEIAGARHDRTSAPTCPVQQVGSGPGAWDDTPSVVRPHEEARPRLKPSSLVLGPWTVPWTVPLTFDL